MHVVIGFESQVDAQAGASALARLARAGGARVTGAALARRDTAQWIHVETVGDFGVPANVLTALGAVVEGGTHGLRPGETALVVSLTGEEAGSALAGAGLEEHGALWVCVAHHG